MISITRTTFVLQTHFLSYSPLWKYPKGYKQRDMISCYPLKLSALRHNWPWALVTCSNVCIVTVSMPACSHKAQMRGIRYVFVCALCSHSWTSNSSTEASLIVLSCQLCCHGNLLSIADTHAVTRATVFELFWSKCMFCCIFTSSFSLMLWMHSKVCCTLSANILACNIDLCAGVSCRMNLIIR